MRERFNALTQHWCALMPSVNPTDSHTAGAVMREPQTGVPTIAVYLSTIADRVRAIQFGPFGRSDPQLGSLRAGHLVGLTIAHEVGHALGLQHAASGPMQPMFEIDDVVALRAARLAFAPSEAGRMRLTLQLRTSSGSAAGVPSNAQVR